MGNGGGDAAVGMPIREANAEELREVVRLGGKVMAFAAHAGMTETFKVAAFVATQVRRWMGDRVGVGVYLVRNVSVYRCIDVGVCGILCLDVDSRVSMVIC